MSFESKIEHTGDQITDAVHSLTAAVEAVAEILALIAEHGPRGVPGERVAAALARMRSCSGGE